MHDSISIEKLQSHAKLIPIPLDSNIVLFDQDAQRVFALNQSASYIWCCLSEVSTIEELLSALVSTFSISQSQAKDAIVSFYQLMQQQENILSSEANYFSFLKQRSNIVPNKISVKKYYLSFDELRYRVSFSDAGIVGEFVKLFDQFILKTPIDNIKNTLIDIQILRDNKNKYSVFYQQYCCYWGLSSRNIIPYIYSMLMESISRHLAKQADYWQFHAAVMQNKRGKTIVFPATSGSGKSTLCAILNANSWQYLADEIATINPKNQTVRAFPFPVNIKKTAVKVLVKFYPELLTEKQFQRLDKVELCFLNVKSRINMVTEFLLDEIIFVQYHPNAKTELTSINNFQALQSLLQSGSARRNINAKQMRYLVNMIEHTRCFQLSYSDVDNMLDKLNAI